jgi:enamine deaminase RidA (YjgF/YER057c/UK114 family)
MKYLRFIDAGRRLGALQAVLAAAAAWRGGTASRSPTSPPLGARASGGGRGDRRRPLGENEHRADNAPLSSVSRSTTPTGRELDEAFAATTPIPGDCGDEYRRPPYLTASGDLSATISTRMPPICRRTGARRHRPQPGLHRLGMGADRRLLPRCARRRRVLVSGHHRHPRRRPVVAPDDAGAQATYVLDKIAAALRPLGAGHRGCRPHPDVPHRRRRLWRRCRGRTAGVRRDPPANTTFFVAGLVGGYKVEIEAEAVRRPPG